MINNKLFESKNTDIVEIHCENMTVGKTNSIESLIIQDKHMSDNKFDIKDVVLSTRLLDINEVEKVNDFKGLLIKEYFPNSNKKLLFDKNFLSSKAFLENYDSKLLNKYEGEVELRPIEKGLVKHGQFNYIIQQLNSKNRQDLLTYNQISSYEKKSVNSVVTFVKASLPSFQLSIILLVGIGYFYHYTKVNGLINWQKELYNILDLEELED